MEIHLLGPVEHWHHQRIHPLKKMNHPLPANSHVSSLKTWKLRLIHNMVDEYVSRRQQRCEPTVDNLSVEQGLYPQQSSGTPASPVLRSKENLQAMCQPEDKDREGAIHRELFWLLRVQSLSLQNWLFLWHSTVACIECGQCFPQE